MGKREKGTEKLEEAVKAFDLALEEFTPEIAPYYRQSAETNRTFALKLLEARRDDSKSQAAGRPKI